MYTSERSMFYIRYKLTWFKDLSGHFVVGVVGVGVEKMSSFLGAFLFPSVSLSLHDLRKGGGTVDHTSHVMAKNAEVYRSLYGRFVW